MGLVVTQLCEQAACSRLMSTGALFLGSTAGMAPAFPILIVLPTKKHNNHHTNKTHHQLQQQEKQPATTRTYGHPDSILCRSISASQRLIIEVFLQHLPEPNGLLPQGYSNMCKEWMCYPQALNIFPGYSSVQWHMSVHKALALPWTKLSWVKTYPNNNSDWFQVSFDG